MSKAQPKNVWLIKHPTSTFYEESQEEIKHAAAVARVKIFDVKFKANINADLVVDHKLTEKVSAEDKAKAKANAEAAAKSDKEAKEAKAKQKKEDDAAKAKAKKDSE